MLILSPKTVAKKEFSLTGGPQFNTPRPTIDQASSRTKDEIY